MRPIITGTNANLLSVINMKTKALNASAIVSNKARDHHHIKYKKRPQRQNLDNSALVEGNSHNKFLTELKPSEFDKTPLLPEIKSKTCVNKTVDANVKRGIKLVLEKSFKMQQ